MIFNLDIYLFYKIQIATLIVKITSIKIYIKY